MSKCIEGVEYANEFQRNPAKQWKSFVKLLRISPAAIITLSLLDSAEDLLNKTGRFYEHDFGINDERWHEFEDIQLVQNYCIKPVYPHIHKDVFAFMEFKESITNKLKRQVFISF